MSVYPSLSLVSLGALSTQWTPPDSCLSTTTVWGNSFFVGYQSGIGLDSQCLPTSVPSTPGNQTTTSAFDQTATGMSGLMPLPTATITTLPISTSSSAKSTPNFMPTGYAGIRSAAFYSPGICPSGFTYAASFTAGRPQASALEERYLCCPDGLTASTSTTKSRRTSKGRVYTSHSATYEYPLCTHSARTLTNVWSMTPGWPTAQPTSFDVGTTTTSASYFYVTASGFVVGWQPSDTAVVDFIEQNHIFLPPFPRPLPETDSAVVSGMSPGALAGVIIGNVIVFLILACCCCAGCRRKKAAPVVPANDGDTSSTTGLTTDTGTPFTLFTPVPMSTQTHSHPENVDVELANFNSQLLPPTANPTPPYPDPAERDADGVFAEAPPRYEEAVKSSKTPAET